MQRTRISVCLRIIARCHACTIEVVITLVHCECTSQRELSQIKCWLGTGERHPFYAELIPLRAEFPRKMNEKPRSPSHQSCKVYFYAHRFVSNVTKLSPHPCY